MKLIPLSAVPNQSFSVRLDNSVYEMTVKEASGCMCIDINRDNNIIVQGQRITSRTPVLPYRYQEKGNFIFLTLNEDLPDYSKFGISQRLLYLSASELEAARA